jgi:hypothetical protein
MINNKEIEEAMQPAAPEFAVVYVLTHTKDGNVRSLYANSLATTIRYCMLNGVKVVPMFISHVDNVAMAKNELLANLTEADYHCAVFIDPDIGWDPVAFFNVVNSVEHVVAIPTVKKMLNNVIFDLDMDVTAIESNENGLIKVNHTSSAFIKISKTVVTQLLDSSISVTNSTGNEIKNVFECTVKDGKFFNESIMLCNKVKEMGYFIWVNPTSTCAQMAHNLYAVDFATALNSNAPPAEAQPEPVVEETLNTTEDPVRSLYE